MKQLLFMICLSIFLCSATQLYGQSGSPIRYGTYPNQISYFLVNPTIQKEMELSVEQKKLITDANKKLREDYAELYKNYPDIRNPKVDYKKRSEMYKELNADYAKLKKKCDEQILENLVPRQLTLLKKLQFNSSIQYYGLSATVSREPFKTALETTSEQMEELKKIKKETDARIQKLMEEERKKAREKMLKVFDAKQRKKIKDYEKDAPKRPYTRL